MSKYNYPYKPYLLGLIIALIFIGYGTFIIYQITFIERNSIIIAYFYLVFAFYIVYWYIKQFKKYRKIFVNIEKDKLVILNNQQNIAINKKDIEYIILARHIQIFKVYKVIHIYTKDNRYYYFTNDLIKFNEFIKVLKEQFQDIFIERKKLIIGFPTITKELLLK